MNRLLYIYEHIPQDFIIFPTWLESPNIFFLP